VKTRLSLRELEIAENSQKKNDFLKALKIVKELPADNPSSFWSIASYHGMPYKKRQVPPYQIPPNDEGNAAWDGYCQHGNVLFPTWHRFYCLKLEQSLQAAVPGGDVMLPYWDQTSEANITSGLPPLLLEKTITIDGVSGIPNPLLNFTLPEAITGPAKADNHDANAKYYVKPKGYTTVRYPFSGISNPTAAKDTADKHNQYIAGLNTDPDTMLAANVRYWLTEGGVGVNIGTYNSISDEYKKALEVSSYNKFSNTSSSAGSQFCLEQAHNEIHLSVGGFSQPFVQEDGSVKVDDDGNIMYFGLIGGANGDMGENETAAFDPCFFMHHCNVDRMFWVWQKKWGHTTSIPLEESSTDTGLTNAGQGPTPYQTPGQQLNFQTALHPYTNVSTGALMTSSDCFNIEKLGYEYSIGSLDQEAWPASATTHKFVELEGKSWEDMVPKLENAVQAAKKPLVVSFDSTHFAPATPESPIVPLQYKLTDKGEDEPAFVKLGRDRFRVRNYLSVKNINKNSVDGSFLVQAFYKKADKLHYIGQRGVLSRWSQEVCGNCMQHPNMAVCFAVNHILPNLKDLSNVVIIIASKDPETGKLIQTRVVQGEPVVFAAGKGSFKPTIHLITSYEQELLGAMEQQAVA
jgi:tyrosinase